MTGAVYEVPPEVLVLLPLPPLDKQSEQQLRGRVCVWCPVTLTAETAMDLGARRHRRQDSHYVTFPRGCRRCTARAAKGLFTTTLRVASSASTMPPDAPPAPPCTNSPGRNTGDHTDDHADAVPGAVRVRRSLRPLCEVLRLPTGPGSHSRNPRVPGGGKAVPDVVAPLERGRTRQDEVSRGCHRRRPCIPDRAGTPDTPTRPVGQSPVPSDRPSVVRIGTLSGGGWAGLGRI